MFDYYIEQFINDFSLSDNAGFYCVPNSDGVMATYQEKDIGGARKFIEQKELKYLYLHHSEKVPVVIMSLKELLRSVQRQYVGTLKPGESLSLIDENKVMELVTQLRN